MAFSPTQLREAATSTSRDSEWFFNELCAALDRDARATMHAMGLLPGRPVVGPDGEPIAGLEGARWLRRPIVWGPHEPLRVEADDGLIVARVWRDAAAGWTYAWEHESP